MYTLPDAAVVEMSVSRSQQSQLPNPILVVYTELTCERALVTRVAVGTHSIPAKKVEIIEH